MDIQKGKDLYLAELLEREVITQCEFKDLVFKPEINAFDSNYLSSWFIDRINFGLSAWQAAKAQAVPDLGELQERIAGRQYYHDEHGHMIVDMDDVVKEISGLDSWKAQVVPGGFVLVSAEQLSQWGHMANYAEQYGCPECFEARGYAHSLACEINEFFAIEPQEPAND